MRVSDFIICDDIRQEVGNKYSLMGVYGDEITLYVEAPEVPAPEDAPVTAIRLGVFARCILDPEEGMPDSFELSIEQAPHPPLVVLQPLVAPRGTAVPRTVLIKMVAPQFPLYGPGHVSFTMIFRHGMNEVIKVGPPGQPFMNVRIKFASPPTPVES